MAHKPQAEACRLCVHYYVKSGQGEKAGSDRLILMSTSTTPPPPLCTRASGRHHTFDPCALLGIDGEGARVFALHDLYFFV